MCQNKDRTIGLLRYRLTLTEKNLELLSCAKKKIENQLSQANAKINDLLAEEKILKSNRDGIQSKLDEIVLENDAISQNKISELMEIENQYEDRIHTLTARISILESGNLELNESLTILKQEYRVKVDKIELEKKDYQKSIREWQWKFKWKFNAAKLPRKNLIYESDNEEEAFSPDVDPPDPKTNDDEDPNSGFRVVCFGFIYPCPNAFGPFCFYCFNSCKFCPKDLFAQRTAIMFTRKSNGTYFKACDHCRHEIRVNHNPKNNPKNNLKVNSTTLHAQYLQ
jgi:hypothetical protein